MADVVYFPGLVPTTFATIETYLRTDIYARARLREADEVLGYSLVDAYRDAEVYDWEVYEAGVLALSLALADWADDTLDLDPVAFGGQSFGAIVGAVWAGVLPYPDALRLVRESTRVELDWFGSRPSPLGCFFFYRLDAATVDGLVARARAEGHVVEGSIYLDNSVHAVSGTSTGLDRMRELVAEAGGHAFYSMNRAEHCSLVQGLRDRLAAEVYRDLRWFRSSLPMLSDVSGALLTDPDDIRDDLLDGWVTPVHWAAVSAAIRRAGADRAVVIGPRTMFGRLTQRTVPTAVLTPRSVLDHPTTAFRLPAPAGAGRVPAVAAASGGAR
ncbi:ACP S-malonyltransferase [Pseudonocardia alni]|uniref:ACP S-malonyltransferase n=1 Tax=Pseudonocardia alni TaxID=33907 RepID=UPI00332CDA79